MSPCVRRAVVGNLNRRMGEERVRRRRTNGGSGRKHELTAPCDEGSRHFGKRAYSCQWMGGLKGRQIWALVDGHWICVASRESEKGRVIPLRDISVGGVKIPVDFINVSREW